MEGIFEHLLVVVIDITKQEDEQSRGSSTSEKRTDENVLDYLS